MLDKVIPAITITYCLFILYLLWRPSLKNRAAFFLSITTLFTMLWSLSIFLTILAHNDWWILFWSRASFFTPVCIVLSLYAFNKCFIPENIQKRTYSFALRAVIVTLISAGVFFMFASFTPLILKSVHNLVSTFGPLQTPYMFFIFLSFAAVDYCLVKGYFLSAGNTKDQFKDILLGIAISSVISIITNSLLPLVYHIEIRYLGPMGTIFFLTFTTYAIMKQQLFNIKLIATESVVILLSLGMVLDAVLTTSLEEGILKFFIWILVTYGGYVLIKSVKKEIQQKEELSTLAKKLDKANQDLEQLDEAKDNFLSMAAHELNTPIAAIEGYLSMILEENMGGKIPTKAQGYLKNVFFSSQRLAGLVHDLLNVSRIESNRIHVVYTEAQIEEVIDQSIAEVKVKADEVGHKLTFEKPDKLLPKTYLDQPRIVEVLINIIGNAIKYTDPPGKIVIKCHADDGKIVVSIEDNGRGIPKDKYNHVFEKFTQVNVLTDQIKGTGLGMFISKNLIELHKGKLWFTSSVDPKDHGTTFYFSLPILKEKPFDPHEGEGALLQTGDKKGEGKTAPTTSPEAGAGVPTESVGKDKKQDESQERLENMVEKQTGNTEQKNDAVKTANAIVPDKEKTAPENPKEEGKENLGPKLEAEIPTEAKKPEKKFTTPEKQDKKSEKLIKEAVEEAEKAPTTSLNETMGKIKD